MKRFLAVTAVSLALGLPGGQAHAQQFNTDNYLAMPHGTGTFVLTAGTEYSALIMSFALFPRWEFFAGVFNAWEDPLQREGAWWSNTLYVKYMPYENEAKNAGLGIAAGTGSHPGYLVAENTTQSFRSFFLIPEATLALFGGRLLWDLNPGMLLNTDYGVDRITEWGFSYSTRVALYGVVPRSAIVGEVFGTAGGAYSEPQYRAGVRWEPSSTFVGAATWSQGFEGGASGGAEVGFMIFTPRFLCFKGCEADDDGE